MVTAPVCVEPGCCALALDGCSRCAVHIKFTVRAEGDVAILCAACGKHIRVGQRWAVLAEGALHVRQWCLLKPAEFWENKVQHPRPARDGASA